MNNSNKKFKLRASEKKLISFIHSQIILSNIDNISRTEAYFHYYCKHPDIRWSFLAHMVSRNAGWNMCDLEGKWFPKAVDNEKRAILFKTYERANWLIFQDAFPQLLLYHYSTKIGSPMFHLLKYFHVSKYMEQEWIYFWSSGDKERLLIALIINEQNVIQKPVIHHPLYKKEVFHSCLFSFQDWFHYSCVIFPTIQGDLFGASVNGFKSVDKRIDLGKRLASILFEQNLYPRFFEFARRTKHSGSRFDYEQYLYSNTVPTTPALRLTFPIMSHHIQQYHDWSKNRKVKTKWLSQTVKHRHPIVLTSWFKKKQKRLHRGILFKAFFTPYSKRKKRVWVDET